MTVGSGTEHAKGAEKRKVDAYETAMQRNRVALAAVFAAAVGHAAMAGVLTPAFRSASHSSASTSNGRMIAISVDGVVVLAPIGLATEHFAIT